MKKTVAIYQDNIHGHVRLGLFTYQGTDASLSAIAQAFHEKLPHAHMDGQLYIALGKQMGEMWTEDTARFPMDPPA